MLDFLECNTIRTEANESKNNLFTKIILKTGMKLTFMEVEVI